MNSRLLEYSVGFFFLFAIFSLIFLAFQVSGLGIRSNADTYSLTARFENASGLNKYAKVALFGVTIGEIDDISIDLAHGGALVRLNIDRTVDYLPIDTSARVVTSGVLGSRYIELSLGVEDDILEENDFIEDTQSAILIEDLISLFSTSISSK